MRTRPLALLLVASCALQNHGPNCAEIESAADETFDTWKVPRLESLATRALTSHEQAHLVEAAFDLSFPDSKMKVLSALLMNKSCLPSAREKMRIRASGESEEVRRFVEIALGGEVRDWRGVRLEESKAGVRVASAPAGSALREADILLGVGGRTVATVADARALAGDSTVIVEVLREGVRLQVELKP
jgi:hypothetical protein